MKPKFKRIEISGEREKLLPKGYMYFVYTPKGNFLLTGANSEKIREYIKNHFPICIYRWSCWKDGKSRGMWDGQHPQVGIHISERRELIDERTYIHKHSNKNIVEFRARNQNTQRLPTKVITFTCRRMPNKWIHEWDDAIKLALS